MLLLALPIKYSLHELQPVSVPLPEEGEEFGGIN